MGTIKKRTLNELRQEKEFGYKTPTNNNKTLTIDTELIIDMVKTFPNDTDLGKNIRNYLINLGLYNR
jgi:hypothetical protein